MIRLKDIATDLGVSTGTVSEVLNDKWRERQISEDLAKSILKRAKELAYRTNHIGRQLRLQKTSTIGVILADLTRSHSTQILMGLEYIFAENEYATFICHSLRDPSREINWLEDILIRRVDGIILEPTSAQNSKFLIEVKTQGIPLVLVDTRIKDFEADFVVTDNFWGAYEGVKFLLKKGHQRIGYLGAIKEKVSLEERFHGYQKAIQDFGLPFYKELVAETHKHEDYYLKMKYLLSLKERPTAIFFASYYYSIGMLKAIKEENLVVPDDLVLCGFDALDLSMEDVRELHLNSFLREVPLMIEQHGYEIGQKAAEILLDKIVEKRSQMVSGLNRVLIRPSLKF